MFFLKKSFTEQPARPDEAHAQAQAQEEAQAQDDAHEDAQEERCEEWPDERVKLPEDERGRLTGTLITLTRM